jgi:hypothetical protein
VGGAGGGGGPRAPGQGPAATRRRASSCSATPSEPGGSRHRRRRPPACCLRLSPAGARFQAFRVPRCTGGSAAAFSNCAYRRRPGFSDDSLAGACSAFWPGAKGLARRPLRCRPARPSESASAPPVPCTAGRPGGPECGPGLGRLDATHLRFLRSSLTTL